MKDIIDPIEWHRCLADETRFQMLLLLYWSKELCVCDFTELVEQVQPKISRHLALLRERGVVSDRRQGRWVYYRLANELPAWAWEVLVASAQARPDLEKKLLERESTLTGTIRCN